MGSRLYPDADPPLVSIVVVARNAGALIDAAIGSARAQTLADIEIVVLDDASTDDTRARAEAHAAADRRVRVLDGPATGLAAVRNASLAAARGRHAAILDSDDVLHPRHLERLVEAATRTGAGMVAANMVEFRDLPAREATLFADGRPWRDEREIGLADFIRTNALYGPPPTLGYIKPLIDLERLRAAGIGYDPRLRIGEDYDLVVRALAAGLRLVMLPAPTYFYRRHSGSTSYRLERSDLLGLLDTAGAGGGDDPDVRAAIGARRATLEAALAHLEAVAAIKARRPGAALRALARPGALPGLIRSVREGLARRVRRAPAGAAGADAAQVVLLGPAAPDAAVVRLADALSARGLVVQRLAAPSPDDSWSLSRTPAPALVLAADRQTMETAACLIAPDAPRIIEEDGVLTMRDGATGAVSATLGDDAAVAADTLVRAVGR